MSRPYKLYSLFLLLSLLLTMFGSLLGKSLSDIEIWFVISLYFFLIIIFFLSKGIVKRIIYAMFCLAEGIFLESLVLSKIGNIALYSLLATFLIVAIFLIIGLKAKNLGFLKSILLISLLTILIYRFIGIFIPLPLLSFILILIFCGYVSYDINKFKEKVNENEDISTDEILEEVMDMYLNIIHIFLEVSRVIIENFDIFDIFDI